MINLLRSEIHKISRNSFHCYNINLDHLINNGNSLMMYHDIIYDTLKFTYIDNSKPYNYLKMNENFQAEWTTFEDKYKGLSYNYPYNVIKEHDRMVAKSWDIFKVFEYDIIKIPESKTPNYNEVEILITDVINRINNNLL